MSKTKKVIIVVFLIVAAVGIGIYFIFVNPPDGGVQPNPLAAFRVMDLPRADVDIGSLWTQGVGPTKRPSGIPRLQSRSLQSTQIQSATAFDTSAKASLLRSLSISSKGSRELQQMMTLKGMSILTVSDESALSLVAGNSYLWEAVRVDQFSLSVSRDQAAQVHAKIKTVTDADSVSESAAGQNSVEIVASGSKLFVAYRVVTISQPTLETVDSTTGSNPSSDINLGNEYSLHFEASRPGETLFDEANCKVKITISSFLHLTADSKPTQSIKEEPCGVVGGGHPDLAVPIGSMAGSQLATIDYLRLMGVKVWPGEGTQAYATGSFAVERRKMQLNTLENPNGPGW